MLQRIYILILTVSLLAFGLLSPYDIRSQNSYNQAGILFYQLNTSHGLSDNYIHDMCVDKSGNLWIASGEGLNMFNGKTVTKFFKEEYPELQTDFTRQVLCDDNNRIWVMDQEGFVTMIDENRKFHKIGLYQNEKLIISRRILKTETYGIILFTNQNFLTLVPGKNYSAIDSLTTKDFFSITIQGLDSSYSKRFSQAVPGGKDSYIFSTQKGFVTVNFQTKQVEYEYKFPGLTILTKWNANELLVYNKINSTTFSINLTNGGISKPLDTVRDQVTAYNLKNMKWNRDKITDIFMIIILAVALALFAIIF